MQILVDIVGTPRLSDHGFEVPRLDTIGTDLVHGIQIINHQRYSGRDSVRNGPIVCEGLRTCFADERATWVSACT